LKYKAWSVSIQDTGVRYVANGKNIPGHLFGFFKMVGNCNQDLLWISWSAYADGLESFQGSDSIMQFQVDDIQFQIQLPVTTVMDAYPTSPSIKVIVFTNFLAGDKLMSLMENGQEVDIQIVGPKELASQFDIKTGSFNLNGFNAARLKSIEICEGLK